ncbi:DUF2087 domain-containing protein [Streptomyces sp. ST2-7A]|uniref:DUF2087 domain-containing protein n=1 Tax=Streptomyces sp. ST2-7A TaxID=2907214 RepID=UPI001F19D197|nr:DUF2087 domain-containing protein [Streptomyces sp. ST2-7A]MCE7080727.1 DUF2087 domain-containing protein [Streptomyces sp. ST2-7A]
MFTDGRVKTIPRRTARRAQVLEPLTRTLFNPGRGYTEREVNEAPAGIHDDSPALRRYLVEAGLLTRTHDGSEYRRTSITQ